MRSYKDHIISDHNVLLGKPVIKGTRISVEIILRKLSEGASTKELAKQYQLEPEAIYAALDYASARLSDQEELVTKK